MAAAAADDLSDDELDAGVEAAIDMPPSSIRLSKLTWRNRFTERMRSNDEWDDFKDNIDNFQGRGTGEADNYSGIRLSDSLHKLEQLGRYSWAFQASSGVQKCQSSSRGL